MVVSIVLDTRYLGVAKRNKWFLKVASNAMKEDTLIAFAESREELDLVMKQVETKFKIILK